MKNKRKTTSSFGLPVKGDYKLFSDQEGFIAVVKKDAAEAVGYMVPKDYAALYSMVIPLAQYFQQRLGYEDPTPEQVDEVFNLVVKELGSSLSNAVRQAVNRTLTDENGEQFCAAEPWDYHGVMPKMGHGVLHGISAYPSKDESTQEDDNEKEAEETGSKGDADL